MNTIVYDQGPPLPTVLQLTDQMICYRSVIENSDSIRDRSFSIVFKLYALLNQIHFISAAQRIPRSSRADVPLSGLNVPTSSTLILQPPPCCT